MKIKGYTRSDGVKVKAHVRILSTRQSTKNYKYGRTYRDKYYPKDLFTYMGKQGFSARGHGVDPPDTWRVRKRFSKAKLNTRPRKY